MAQYPPAQAERGAQALPGAVISWVEEDTPAYDAGFEPGCVITTVNGQRLRDVIDWRWLSADDEITLGYIDLDGEQGEIELWREEGESWGLEFRDVVFDGIKLCRNACTFCFMRQLPEDVRSSLILRDDDFRLSFLSGTFVTLTNLSAEDEQRIIDQHISPLRVSLHASNPEVRRFMIGKHAQHGLDALERLLAAGIQVDAQIVLVPGQNDGSVLAETLEWASQHPNILQIGIVPLGYTKHQTCFNSSFNDVDSARGVVDTVESFAARMRPVHGFDWVFCADEFYCNAYGKGVVDEIPNAQRYGSFEMFEDGIGIVRSFIDDFRTPEAMSELQSLQASCKAAASRINSTVSVNLYVGEALCPVFAGLIQETPEIKQAITPVFVKNEYFGGNVDVTGLLVGEDLARAIARQQEADVEVKQIHAIMDVVLNDDGLFLDGYDLQQLQRETGTPVHVVSCSPMQFLTELTQIVSGL